MPFISEPKLPRKLRAPDYSINIHFGSSCVKSVQIRSYFWSVFFCIRTWNNSVFWHFSRSSSNKQNNAYHPNTPLDYYRVIYYEALDSLITSLKERFDQPCFKAYENLESLLLKSLSNERIANEIDNVKCPYKGELDVDQLVVQLHMFKAICQNESFICFEDVRQHMQNRTTEDFIFIPNVINIIKLAALNLATNATAERTFSLARNLKTWLWPRMLPTRFNSLALLKFPIERTDNVNLLNVVGEFVSKETRLGLFGRFTDKDF